MRAFKFMNAEHVHCLMDDHTVRLGSYEYYRNVEAADEWIKDETEGITVATSGTFVTEGVPDDPRLARMPGLDLGSSEGVSIDENEFSESYPRSYIFCCSRDPFEAARKAMCEDAPEKDRYDACVEITDIEAFSHAVCETGEINSRRLKDDLVTDGRLAEVTYDKKISDLSVEDWNHHEWQKPPKFASQQEYRLVVRPTDQLQDDAINVTVHAVAGLLKRVF